MTRTKMIPKPRGREMEAPVALQNEVVDGLAGLGDPLGDVFAVLDSSQLNDLLNRVGKTQRTQLLQRLRVPAMGKLTPTICSHALSQLRSQRSLKQRQYDAQILGGPLFDGLSQARAHWVVGNRDGVLEEILEQSPRAELLLTAVAFWQTDPGQARVLAWALRNRALPSWPADQVLALAGDCDRLADEWADRQRTLMAGPLAGPRSSDAENTADGGRTERVFLDSAEQCEEAAERLQRLFDLAAADLRKAVGRLETGAAPDSSGWEATEALLGYLPAVRAALSAVHDQPLAALPEHLKDLLVLLRDRARGIDNRKQLLPALDRAAHAPTAHEHSALVELCQHAERLAGAVTWDDGDAELAALLAEVVALADAVQHDDDSQIERLDGRLRTALPEAMRSVLLPVLRGKVAFPALRDVTAPSECAEPDDPLERGRPSPGGESLSRTRLPQPVPADTSKGTARVPEQTPPEGSAGSVSRDATDPPPRHARDQPGDATATATDTDLPGQRPTPESETTVPDSRTELENLSTAARTLPDAPQATETPDNSSPARGEDTDPVDGAVAQLLGQREPALAYHAARAADCPHLAASLRLYVLSDAMRTATGACADAVRAEIACLVGQAMPVGVPDRLLRAAALFRACLVSADPVAGELLRALAESLYELLALRETLMTAAEACARGQLSVHGTSFGLATCDTETDTGTGTGTGTGTEIDTDADVDVSSVCGLARESLAEPRTLHFPRANDIVREWWSEHGLIGHILHTVARDDRARLDAVRAELLALRKPEALERRLASTDQQKRNNKQRLQGAARRRILQYAHESLDLAHDWLTSVQNLASFQPPAVFSHLAARIKEHGAEMETELAALAKESDPLASAAASTCLEAMRTSVTFLQTARLPGAEPGPTVALNADLLRCSSLEFDVELNPLRPVSVDDVHSAQRTDWETAARQHAAAENYATARTALEMFESHAGRGDVIGALREEHHRLRAVSRQEVSALHQRVTHDAETAARLGQLPEPGRSLVTARLEAANRAFADDNFGTIRRECNEIVHQLETLSGRAKSDFRAAAAQQLNESDAPTDLADEIRALIARGDLATAEEFLIAAREGFSPPTADEVTDFGAFFPAVCETLRSGITPDWIKDAANGAQRGALDFSELTAAQRSQAAEALTALHQLHSQWNSLRTKTHHLRLALRLAGIEYGQEQDAGLTNPPNRRWFDITDVKLVGPARLPQFGSGTDGRLRVMTTRTVSDARTLMGWIEQDVSQLPVLVVVTGALSVAQRQALAQATVTRRDKPILVLDACALAFLVARGTGLFATTERILAPFSAVTPYFPEASDTLPAEMFYGRSEELSAVLDPQGSSILYGGRRLGKSALLKAAAARYRRTKHHESLYIPLPSGMGLTPEVLWDLLARSLEQSGIAKHRKHRAKTMHQVEEDINAWLQQDKARKLLILFDECDEFFDGDARKGFIHTTALRNLMSANSRRFKPVFAGLHQVQRFAALPNQPLAGAHFGEPLVIGPLSPGAAYRLLHDPMQALGIRFHSDTLIHRALAYANYHPKIIQHIGLALVLETHKCRTPADGPPWTIDEDMLERVIGSAALKKSIRDTVRLTLHLDPRYKLIALVLALYAYRHGVDQPIAGRELRAECNEWWPHALSVTTPDEYRALLEEMAGLGVLAADDTGWRLRSSNVLRLLGTPTSIEEELSVQESDAVTALSATNDRRRLPKDSISPLTEAQVADLTTKRNGLRIVLGTSAAGLDDVVAALESQRERIPGRLAPLITPTTRSDYKKQLQAGTRGRSHRVIVSDMRKFGPEALRLALDQAVALQPPEGVTRCVVALIDPSNVDHMRELTAADEENMVFLRLTTADGLRSWISDQDAMAPYSDSAQRDALLKATGGWTSLLNHVLRLANRGCTPQKALDQLTTDLENAAGASLLESTGLIAAVVFHPIVEQLVEFDAPLPMEDLVDLLQPDHPEALHLLTALRRVNAIVDNGRQELAFEPVLAAAWRKQGPR